MFIDIVECRGTDLHIYTGLDTYKVTELLDPIDFRDSVDLSCLSSYLAGHILIEFLKKVPLKEHLESYVTKKYIPMRILALHEIREYLRSIKLYMNNHYRYHLNTDYIWLVETLYDKLQH